MQVILTMIESYLNPNINVTLTPIFKFYPLRPSNFINLNRLVFAFWTVHFRISGPSFLSFWTVQFDTY